MIMETYVHSQILSYFIEQGLIIIDQLSFLKNQEVSIV